MLEFKLDSVESIIDLIHRASILEFSTNKPGNIGPDQAFDNVNYEDYLKVNNSIRENLRSVFKNKDGTLRIIPNNITLGELIYSSVETMMNDLPYKNLLLGYILLFSPILYTYSQLLIRAKSRGISISWEDFWMENQKNLENTTSQDGVWLYRAISLAQAGGLKKPGGKPIETKYDFTKENVDKLIIDDNRTLISLYYESSEFDMISREMTQNYEFCKNIYNAWLLPKLNKGKNIKSLVAPLFLYILSKHPDSLIYRKNDLMTAQLVQSKAKQIIETGGYDSDLGRKEINKLNHFLLKKAGKLNPGTTADLTACCILISLLFNLD